MALVAFASTLLALALAPSFWTFVAISIPLGFASASFQSVNTVVLHHATEPSMQGKVMALHQMAWFGSTPIGALFMGWIIHVSSLRVPFVLGALASLISAAALPSNAAAATDSEATTSTGGYGAAVRMSERRRSDPGTRCLRGLGGVDW
ncbi:MAG: MFS transporter [Ilumatobacteraceae bacterium]|nr:MFS transporter [Ilumatobacteraceae bacterium]